jgi:Protein of unknown function (DUF3307)
MTADPILTLAWLGLAHLVADFVLQTGGIAADKTSTGPAAVRGLLTHGLGVAICLVPFAAAFGPPGLWTLGAITVAHLLIDRAKVVATHRAEARALADAGRRHEGRAPAAGLGRAWTPLPAVYFALDQLGHVAVLAIAWAIWLAGRAPTAEWTSAIDRVLTGRDPASVHGVVLTCVVLGAVLIANVRGGALFVATLVRPLEAATGADAAGVAASAPEAAGSTDRAGHGWSFRIGPLVGRVVADATPPASDSATVVGERVVLPPPAQVGATIGVLERLLIVTLMLAGAEAAIGFVIAAKTIARFRLLDDRDFAEYYLLGTLASVSVAILTSLIARAALSA